MNIIETLEKEEIARLTQGKTIPSFRAGDTVNVLVNVIEGTHKRTQAYEGVVTAVSILLSSFARSLPVKAWNVRSRLTPR